MSIQIGILVLRVLFGASIATYGAQKLFGAFGGYGLKGTGAFFETLGFRPGILFAALAGLNELAGGLLLVLGLFTPLAAAMVLATAIVAMASVHLKNGFFAANNGIELPFHYAAAALAVLFTGAGAYSLDDLLGLRFVAEPAVTAGLLILTIVGVALALSLRRYGPPQATAAVQ
jgi:putative oxidoreductase